MPKVVCPSAERLGAAVTYLDCICWQGDGYGSCSEPSYFNFEDTFFTGEGGGAICGDGAVEGTEECDDGNTVNEYCSDGVVQSGSYCNSDCSAVISLSEQCDDGNTNSGDCCSSTCTNEPAGSQTCGVGACFRTFAQCSNGFPVTCTPGTPTTEVCNTIDDNCNSLVDDNALIKQFGTASDEQGYSVSVDSSGNFYVAGYTDGTLPGQPHPGGRDAYVRKYNRAGVEQWTREFGTSATDSANDVSVDSSGNVYVAGSTSGTLPNCTSSNIEDAFVRKYDSSGNVIWTRQFGTVSNDKVMSISLDSSGNVYVTGDTQGTLPGCTPSACTNSGGMTDVFVRKYDSSGNVIWTRQFGTSLVDSAYGVSADSSGNIYVAGSTSGVLPNCTSLANGDAFVRKYDSNGNEQWTRQFGTSSSDNGMAVSVDSSANVYVVGQTWGGTFSGQTSSGGDTDAFVRKYDSSGNVIWTRQFGSSGGDFLNDVSTASSGNVYVTGRTTGTLPGQTSSGATDAYVRNYDSSGNVIWTIQFGTSAGDLSYGVSADSFGNIYVAGTTGGALLGQTNSGNLDAFIYRTGGTICQNSVTCNLPSGVTMQDANGNTVTDQCQGNELNFVKSGLKFASAEVTGSVNCGSDSAFDYSHEGTQGQTGDTYNSLGHKGDTSSGMGKKTLKIPYNREPLMLERTTFFYCPFAKTLADIKPGCDCAKTGTYNQMITPGFIAESYIKSGCVPSSNKATVTGGASFNQDIDLLIIKGVTACGGGSTLGPEGGPEPEVPEFSAVGVGIATFLIGLIGGMFAKTGKKRK